MKKQINPTIKAHLIRSAFYVILLLAVCVIPFALAQRNTTRQSAGRTAASPKLAAKKTAANPKLAPHATSLAPGNMVGKGSATAPGSTYFSRAPGAGKTRATAPKGTACGYDFTVSSDTFVPGVDDIGNHTDDGGTFISLPFTVHLYGQDFTGATAGSNGHLTFGNVETTFQITCDPFGVSGATDALAPYWGDQCTGACNTTPCTGCGIFTTTTGTAPNRI